MADDVPAPPATDPVPTGTPRTGRRKTRLRVKLLALLVPVLLTGALVEIIVRLTQQPVDLYELTGRTPVTDLDRAQPWRAPDPLCAYRPRPGHQPLAGKTINSDGYASTPELPVGKATGEVRLAFFGGSSTFGIRLRDEETWPWRVHERLQARLPGTPITFLNAGAPGYTTVESLARLVSRVRYHRPDIAVVYHGWNEMVYFREPASLRTHRLPREVRLVQVEPSPIDPLVAWSQVLSRVRIAFGEWRHGEVAARPDHSDLATDFDPAALDAFRANLALLRDTAHSLGIELFVVQQATLITNDLPAADRERCRLDFHGFDYDAHLRAWQAIYGVIDEEIPAGHVIDATSLSGVSGYFHDHIHLTPDGADRLAALVADRLDPAVTGRAAGQPD